MALTVSLTGDWLKSSGNQKAVEGTITFDSSYLTGGEVITAAMVGLGSLDSLMLDQGEDGYIIDWIRTSAITGLLKVRGGAREGNVARPPTLVVDEVVTVGSVSDIGVLRHKPAYIVSIEVVDTESVSGAFEVIPTGKTPKTKDCAVTYTTGVLTFLATDDVNVARVTYFPQQVDGMFATSNLVIDEAHTTNEDSFALTNRAFAVQLVYDSTDSVVMPIIPQDESPGALEVTIEIVDSSSDTLITKNTAENANDLLITYMKHSGLESGAAVIDDAVDITLTGTDPEKWNFATDGSETDLVVPGLGPHIIGEEGTTNQDIRLVVGQSTLLGEDIARWLPETNEIQTQQTGTMTVLMQSWFTVPKSVLQQRGSEAVSGTDLSAVVVRFRATGR